jgi:very-short-patch-repair endonuclease
MLGHNATLPLDARLNRFALSQLGVITRSDALRIGMSKDSLRRRVEAGLLIRMHPGVYRLAATDESFEQRCLAACLTVSGSVLGDRSAAFVHGLPVPEPRRPEIVLPHGSRLRIAGLDIRQTRFEPSSRPWMATRITTVAATLVGLAHVVDADSLARCLDEAIASRATTVAQVRRELSARSPGRFHGRPLLVDELDKRADGRVRQRSRLEQKVQRWLHRSGLSAPLPNFLVKAHQRTYEVDFAWPLQRLCLEVSPFYTHGSAKTQQHDAAKRRALAAVGWRIVEATDPELVGFAAFQPVAETLRSLGVGSAL